MNEKQPYEQHLANKLQHLPPPADMNRSWEQMRKLLDDEMPRGGGFGGGKRWWMAGIITGILILGAWLADSQLSKKKTPVAATPGKANTEETTAGTTTASAIDPSLKNVNGAQPLPGNAPAETARVISSPAEKNNTASSNSATGNSTAAKAAATNAVSNEIAKNEATGEAANKQNSKNKNTIDGKNLLVNNNNNSTAQPTANGKNNQHPAATGNSIQFPGSKTNGQQAVVGDNSTANYKSIKPVKPEEEIIIISSVVNKEDLTAAVKPSESITKEYEAISANVLFPESELVKKKALAKSRSSNAGKSRTDHSFAIGLSLPLAFPLGDQKALSYNSNAGVNTVSDYIPSPHLQYHFNDKTYLQTEVQVMSPQYIRPILLYQQKDVIPATNSYVYNSVYAKKLYYFNLPVVVHHSPFKNFYLGTGLQFSSLLSGVALYEQRKYTGGGTQSILMHEQYTRFSNDSLSNRFNTAEMRLLLDVNYYFNKFTVGLRYNQAFNNYVSFRLNNTTGYTFDKNKTLQFYLRYNIWEDLKRKKSATSFLSFK